MSPYCFLTLDHLFCFLIPSCKETKMFPHVIFKTRWSIPNFTDFVTRFYLPLEVSITVLNLYKRAHHKGWWANGNCSSHVPVLCLTVAKKPLHLFSPIVLRVNTDIKTLFSPWNCEIDTITPLVDYPLHEIQNNNLSKSFSCGSGGTSLPGEKLQDCINRATLRQKEIQKLIVKVLNSVKTPQ